MVQTLTTDLHANHVTNATAQWMDAEHLAFPSASFDAVLCSHALPLFSHVEQAIAEFHRVLRPGGRVGVCVPLGGDERWMWYTQLVFAYYRTYHLPINWVPRIVSLADVTQMLHTVGVVELSTATQNYEFAYGTEQEWWEAQWTDAARFPLEGMPPAVLKQFKAEVIARLVAMKQADWLHAWRKAGAVVGIKPLVDHGQ